MAYRVFSDGEVLTGALVQNYLMKQSIVVCTSSTRPSSPVEGQFIWETDTKQLKLYNGTTWVRAGVYDQDTSGAQQWTDSTTISGITSTTFAAGSPVVGGTFVAPASGAIYASVTGFITQSSNGFETRLGWEIRTGGVVGSGSVLWAASSLRSVTCGRAVNGGGAALVSATHRFMAGSFTAGITYNIRSMHNVTGGTGQVEYRAVLVEPVS